MGEPGDLRALLAAASCGDQEAWNAIVTEFSSLLWSVARAHRLNHDDAADVVQNTWLRLTDRLHTIEKPEALAGWLATTARNEALTMLRRQGREHLVRDEDVAERVVDEEAVQLDTALLDSERDRALWTEFTRLPESCQRLLRVLMSCDRPNYRAVSEALSMSVGSIGPTRMRCLDKLRRLLRESDYPFDEGGES
jgi:RNA polymerase sigma factor (sigma-70 family)